MAEPDPSTFITLQEVLGLYPWMTERWLRRAVHEKRVPFYKVGGRLLFDPQELAQYVRDQRVDAKVSAKPTKRIPRHKKVN
jgi:hypothetical protein